MKTRVAVLKFNKISKENVFAILYLISFCFRFFTNMNKAVTAIVWTVSGAIVLLNCFVKLKNRLNIIYLMIAVDFIAIINGFINGNATYTDAIYIVLAQGFGMELFVLKKDWKVVRTLMLLMYVYILVRIIFFPLIDIHGDKGISILIGKNSISIIMLFICIIDLIYRDKNNMKINYLPCIIGILISFLTDSNGGILAFTLFTVGIYVCGSKGNKLSWKKILILIFAGGGIIISRGYMSQIIQFLTDDNSRFAIWNMYISLAKKNLGYFLFGAPLIENSILFRYFNIHNNFLNWHCYFGIIPMLFFCWIIILEGIYYIRHKRWYYIVIWGVMLVRSLTDGTDYCFMSLWIFMLLDMVAESGLKIEKSRV